MPRNSKNEIPDLATELTPTFFAMALAGNRADAVVEDVETETVGEGIGFVGELFRCRLRWSLRVDDLPSSVIVKIPSKNEQNRSLAEALAAYEREIVVYRELAQDLGLPAPACYFADFDPHPAPWFDAFALRLFEWLPLRTTNWLIDRLLSIVGKSTRRYVLLLEDIEDARPPTQAVGGSLDDATAALRALARSHAATWQRTDLAERSDLLWRLDRAPKIVMASYLRYRDDFFDRFRDAFTPELIEHLDEIQASYAERVGALSEGPTVLLHGDYRLDNVLFRPDGSLVVVDYQGVGIGRPGWDVGYFITTALDPGHRSEEQALLAAYYDELVASGARGYSREELLADVRQTGDLLAHRMVCAGDLLDTDRGDGEESLVDLLVLRVLGWTAPETN